MIDREKRYEPPEPPSPVLVSAVRDVVSRHREVRRAYVVNSVDDQAGNQVRPSRVGLVVETRGWWVRRRRFEEIAADLRRLWWDERVVDWVTTRNREADPEVRSVGVLVFDRGSRS